MSDTTTKGIIDRITIRYPEPREIVGGHCTDLFYDSISLTPSELARLAAIAVGGIDRDLFDLAVGIAYTGIMFASAVAGGKHVAILKENGEVYGPEVKGKRVIIVDDVVFRGGALNNAANILKEHGAKVVGFACIVDRSKGERSYDIDPLYSAYECND